MQKKRFISAALARFDCEAAAGFHAGRANAPERLLIAGIDEAGRGPLAGPVVAAAVVLPEGSEPIEGVNDSKKLTEKQREALFGEIHQRAVAVGVGIVDAETIDQINILEATRFAACQALKSVRANGVTPDLLLLDALKLSGEATAQQSIIKGDAQSRLRLRRACARVE
ncbi:MAG: hypothetical protein NTX50_12915 [Candidatus Sumerlaeota bacterium]|nr:hypothetical protein [Candidatus Sumerlaeota bacterium]